MESEISLDEAVKKALVDLMMFRKDVWLHVKRWGVREIEKTEGDVINLEPRKFIEFINRKSEIEYRHFCGPYHGIVMVEDKANKLLYINPRIYKLDDLGYTQNKPLRDNALRKEVLEGGVFLLGPDSLPKEISF
jgi:hypothetical protein